MEEKFNSLGTGGSVGTDAGEVVKMVDACSSVLTRPAFTFVYFQLAMASSVARFTSAAVVVSTVDTRAMHADHVLAVVWV